MLSATRVKQIISAMRNTTTKTLLVNKFLHNLFYYGESLVAADVARLIKITDKEVIAQIASGEYGNAKIENPTDAKIPNVDGSIPADEMIIARLYVKVDDVKAVVNDIAAAKHREWTKHKTPIEFDFHLCHECSQMPYQSITLSGKDLLNIAKAFGLKGQDNIVINLKVLNDEKPGIVRIDSTIGVAILAPFIKSSVYRRSIDNVALEIVNPTEELADEEPAAESTDNDLQGGKEMTSEKDKESEELEKGAPEMLATKEMLDRLAEFKPLYYAIYDKFYKMDGDGGADYSQKVEEFDARMKSDPEFNKFACLFANDREDYISSDREAAAFVVAYDRVFTKTNRQVAKATRKKAEKADARDEEISRLKKELEAARRERDLAQAEAETLRNRQPAAAAVNPAAIAEKLAADFPGLTVTVKGEQTTSPVIWISGETKPHAPELKKHHAVWSPKRQAWYMKVKTA